MKLTIRFDLDNDVFIGSMAEEITRIIHDLMFRLTPYAEELSSDGHRETVLIAHDVNGNTVGYLKIVNE